MEGLIITILNNNKYFYAHWAKNTYEMNTMEHQTIISNIKLMIIFSLQYINYNTQNTWNIQHKLLNDLLLNNQNEI